MKVRLWILCGGVCGIAFLVAVLGRKQEFRPQTPVSEQAQLPRADIAAPSEEEGATDPDQPAQLKPAPEAAAHFAKVTKAITIADVPDGIFRNQLEDLEPDALKRALAILSEIEFEARDAESMRVDENGMIFFVCTFGVPDPERMGLLTADVDVELAPTDGAAGAAVPISSPPIRHSKSGASRVIYLDFNGGTISGTAWNNSKGVSSWNCRAYSSDGDYTTFSDTEQAAIIQIWERVAEDFAPFDVDVTTEAPVSWNSQIGHAMITQTTDATGKQLPHYGYGGIAYVGVWGNSSYSYNAATAYSPAWVTGTMSVSSIAEATSHEVGHNLGLSHDGTSAAEYYSGHSNGQISWGPIMGAAYGCNITQWSKGEYYLANRTQDDLAIVSGKLTYRGDDHGDSNGAATALSISSGSFSDTGIIETTSDPDVFSFVVDFGGDVTVSADPYKASSSSWGSNLDIELRLYNSGGSLLETSNPTTTANASITRSLSVGTYYVHVCPAALGSPTSSTPTGYTIYGSLGQYTLSGTIPTTEPFVFKAFALDGRVQLRWTDPTRCGRLRSDVIIRAATDAYPPDSTSGRLVYSGTDQSFLDTSLPDNVTQYYSVWATDDGVTYVAPE